MTGPADRRRLALWVRDGYAPAVMNRFTGVAPTWPPVAPAWAWPRRRVGLALLGVVAVALGGCTRRPPATPAGAGGAAATAPAPSVASTAPAPAPQPGPRLHVAPRPSDTPGAVGSVMATATATAPALPPLSATPVAGPGSETATPLPTPGTAAAAGVPSPPTAPAAPPSATSTVLPAPALPDGAPATLAGVHFAGDRYTAADVFGGGPDRTGWTVELAYASDGAPEAVARRLTGLHRRGFRVILRVDFARGQHIPPADDPAAVAAYVDFVVKTIGAAGGRVRHVVVGNEGNIDEAGDDPRRNTECRLGRETCAPAAYAAVYRAVRDALRPRGDVAVLVAGVSPGDADHPARWMSGPDHLAAVLRLLGPGDVDGVALHAYGLEQAPVPGLPAEPLGYFQALVTRQLDVMTAAGHARTPVYITEMNAYTRPEAAFVRAAYAWLDGLNRTGRARIRAACWFVLDGGGAWDDVALAGRPDILAVLREVAQRYAPGA